MRAVVTGGRDNHDIDLVYRVMRTLKVTELAHGGARGIDHCAAMWADDDGVPTTVYKADWSAGKKAGPLRNQRMLEEFKPDAVVAFRGGRGTADMVRRARDAGVLVLDFSECGGS